MSDVDWNWCADIPFGLLMAWLVSPVSIYFSGLAEKLASENYVILYF
jgi:hypothetical protein